MPNTGHTTISNNPPWAGCYSKTVYRYHVSIEMDPGDELSNLLRNVITEFGSIRNNWNWRIKTELQGPKVCAEFRFKHEQDAIMFALKYKK